MWIGAAVSGAIHLLLVGAALVVWFSDWPRNYEKEVDDEEASMEVILEEEALATSAEVDDTEEELEEGVELLSELRPEEEALEEEREQPEEEEEEELDEEEDEEEIDEEFPQEQPLDRYAVDQHTDAEEEPEEADHISDEAHRTDEETVAETTTLEDVEPEKDPEALEQEADTPRELAMEMVEEEPEIPDLVDPDRMDEPDDAALEAEEWADDEEIAEEEAEDDSEAVDEEEAVAEQEPAREYRDPAEMFVDDSDAEAEVMDEEQQREALFGSDRARADEVLGGDEAMESRASQERSRSGRQLLSNWRENEEAMRAALENFIPHVQPGNHTSVNATAAAHASYIARMHRSIHARWAERFIPRVSRNFSRGHELNDMSLVTVVEIVIDAEAQEVVEVVRVQPSGSDMFDAEALRISREIEDVSDPPPSIVSADGKIYIHWTFWRDQRRCGTFGVRIFEVEDSGQPPPSTGP